MACKLGDHFLRSGRPPVGAPRSRSGRGLLPGRQGVRTAHGTDQGRQAITVLSLMGNPPTPGDHGDPLRGPWRIGECLATTPLPPPGRPTPALARPRPPRAEPQCPDGCLQEEIKGHDAELRPWVPPRPARGVIEPAQAQEAWRPGAHPPQVGWRVAMPSGSTLGGDRRSSIGVDAGRRPISTTRGGSE